MERGEGTNLHFLLRTNSNHSSSTARELTARTMLYTDGRTDKQTDRQTDRRMDRRERGGGQECRERERERKGIGQKRRAGERGYVQLYHSDH